MGVPFYFKKLLSNYPEITSDSFKSTDPCLFLDFNGIIHQCSHKVIYNDNFTEQDIFDEIKKYLYELVDKFSPKIIYAAVDGVAPLSKIKQQRQRRFKAAYYQQNKNKILRKYNEKIIDWNSNCITPGTKFMDNLNKFLKTIDINNLIISDSSEEGEGEHKMFNYIKQNKWIDNIIIHGLDADLIFLSLISNIPNINIYRDNNDDETYLNIDILKKAIITDLSMEINNTIDESRLIKDYVMICFLLGNDFLPRINSLDIISNNGLALVESHYTTVFNEEKNYMINDNNTINYKFFTKFIQEISKDEQKNINKANNKYIDKRFYNKNNLDGKELEVTKFDFYPLFHKTYINYSNIFDWKIEYYNHYFPNINNKNIIIEQYLIGIQWILNYYINGKSPNNWYYPFLNSPILEDINIYLKKMKSWPRYVDSCNIKITSTIQLMLVLPKSSHYLLPERVKNVFHSELKYLYPTKFFIDTHLNTYLHQCIPFIPNFNISKIQNYMNTKLYE